MSTTPTPTNVVEPAGSEREPLLLDLECLAHELENDCNYPFAGIRDARGELYSTKLSRLREQIGNIDAMLEDSREMVALLRDCYWALYAVVKALRLRGQDHPHVKLVAKLADSPAVKPILRAVDSALEECDLCHDQFPISQVENFGGQILCWRCKSSNPQ